MSFTSYSTLVPVKISWETFKAVLGRYLPRLDSTNRMTCCTLWIWPTTIAFECSPALPTSFSIPDQILIVDETARGCTYVTPDTTDWLVVQTDLSTVTTRGWNSENTLSEAAILEEGWRRCMREGNTNEKEKFKMAKIKTAKFAQFHQLIQQSTFSWRQHLA